MAINVFGEALVDLILGEQGAFEAHLGGSPYNVAIGLARQGIEVTYLTRLSKDRFGQDLLQSLRRESVLCPLGCMSELPTSLALVSFDNHRQPAYELYRNGVADVETHVDDVLGNLSPGLRVFHSGSLALTPDQQPKLMQIIEHLRGRGVLISLDVNLRRVPGVDESHYRAGVIEAVKKANIVKASDEDLIALGFVDEPRVAAESLYGQMEPGLFVLTEGRHGSSLLSPRGWVTRPVHGVTELVDTVGAGDVFHAALLASVYDLLDSNHDLSDLASDCLERLLDYANAAAALNVMRSGCHPPTRDEVTRFLKGASLARSPRAE